LFSAETLKRIEEFSLVPNQLDDAGDLEDEAIFDDDGDGISEDGSDLELKEDALDQLPELLDKLSGLVIHGSHNH
jgi:hypothetical protein